MTDTDIHTNTVPARTLAPLFRRGRHRKPRPRKALIAAGGLALAASALSLVRLAPDAGVGVPRTAEAEPRPDTGATTDRSVTIGAVPTELPSATSTMGGVSGRPTPAAASSPMALPGSARAAATAPPATVPTTIPTKAEDPAAPAATPRPSATHHAPASPQAPVPAPSRSTGGPAPTRSQPGGVCVPIIGLCVERASR
ncbi:hypothetical protein ACFY0F_11505 [Streptomyces sp. NPDC001544]|uniref:hypothetical protein n=1 Tax=Streptomyces sp. NPDC001544 TaxID=3364584 RepID=UPI0036BA82EF